MERFTFLIDLTLYNYSAVSCIQRRSSPQYLAACHLPDHPSRKHLARPPAPRSRKNTETMLKYKPDIQTIINTPEIDRINYKEALKEIHTKSVSETLNSYANNQVLGTAPPKVYKEEKGLPQKIRS